MGMAVMLAVMGCQRAAAQELSEEEMKKANNPMANAKSFNVQDYYVSSIYDDADVRANTMMVRFASPFAKGRVLVRATLPVSTVPTGPDAGGKQTYASGLGDLNVFATFVVTKPGGKWLIGIGPQIVVPTASRMQLGAGKVQAGGALIAFNTHLPTLQWGGLVTYQHSVAGQSDRADAQLLIAQPIGFFQLGKGAYLRSSGSWSFDLESGAYAMPVGFGAGHVVKAGKIVFNIFLEPQLTVLHYGPGQAAFQLFSGINAQF